MRVQKPASHFVSTNQSQKTEHVYAVSAKNWLCLAQQPQILTASPTASPVFPQFGFVWHFSPPA
jgi:hypothetical protein